MTSGANLPDAPPVIFLMGPTASGKTELALYLTARLPCDIVSVDSAMVYRGMDVGTAKPAPEVLARTPHRLIDIRDPAQTYSAADFVADARREIDAIHGNGRIPLLVGGTMLYFRALEQGLSVLPAADAAVRERLTAQAREQGWPALHRRLAAADSEAAARIHANDGQRIQRALEVLTLAGEPISRLQARSSPRPPVWRFLKLAVTPDHRALLHRRIEHRFQTMLDAGFVAEVEKLYSRPDLNLDTPALRAVGYRQLWHYLDGDYSLTQAAQCGVIATRRLAKRQLTWLRRERDLIRLDAKDTNPDTKAFTRIRAALEEPGGVLNFYRE